MELFKNYDKLELDVSLGSPRPDKVAVLDMDDCLGSMAINIIEEVNKRYGTSRTIDSLAKYQALHLLIPESVDDRETAMRNLLDEVGCFDLFKWYPKVGEFIGRVRDGSIDGVPVQVALITSRGYFWKSAVSDTMRHLLQLAVDIDHIHVIDYSACKVEHAIGAFGSNLHYIVEDNPSTLKRAYDRGVTTFKVEMPYNEDVVSSGLACAQRNVLRLINTEGQ